MARLLDAWLNFPELISLRTSINFRSFYCVLSKVCTEATSLLKILMRFLKVLYFPIELLFISSCFPSMAKQAWMGGTFPLGKETDNKFTRKTFGWDSIDCVSGGGLGECYFLNLHFRSVY